MKALAVAAVAAALHLPAGYHATVYASGLQHPTAMSFGPNGRLYVSEDVGSIVSVTRGTRAPRPFARGLTVPLGYTLNLAGTAVYLVVATLFLSEALDIALPPDRLALYLAVMLATSKTAAGVSGSGFSALLLTLSLLPDIPLSAAAMLIAVDRILSPIRATTSGLANISATLLVTRWNGTRIERIKPPATPPPGA